MQRCNKCGVEKPRTEFHANQFIPGDIRRVCKACQAAYNRDRYRSNRTKVLSERRAMHLAKYGLTLEQFEEMLADQGGVCALCGTDKPGGVGTWHVDHDHACCPTRFSCGRCIRALLCMRCNQRVGTYENHKDAIEAYLERYGVEVTDGAG